MSQTAEKQVKQKGRVGRAGRRLGVKLHREEGLVRVNDTLVRPVVGIDEEGLPVGRQRLGIDREALDARIRRRRIKRWKNASQKERHTHARDGQTKRRNYKCRTNKYTEKIKLNTETFD